MPIPRSISLPSAILVQSVVATERGRILRRMFWGPDLYIAEEIHVSEGHTSGSLPPEHDPPPVRAAAGRGRGPGRCAIAPERAQRRRPAFGRRGGRAILLRNVIVLRIVPGVCRALVPRDRTPRAHGSWRPIDAHGGGDPHSGGTCAGLPSSDTRSSSRVRAERDPVEPQRAQQGLSRYRVPPGPDACSGGDPRSGGPRTPRIPRERESPPEGDDAPAHARPQHQHAPVIHARASREPVEAPRDGSQDEVLHGGPIVHDLPIAHANDVVAHEA